MKTIDFWFDPVSPFVHLAFAQLPDTLRGHSHLVRYRPLLFAGLLAHWGQKGPAEIEPKRAWTYRQVAWLAQRHGITLQLPAQHPFNPLALLRLLLASAPEGELPNRRACELVLHHVWHGGLDANDADRVAALHALLSPTRDPGGADVKAQLRAATAEAASRGIFGVPTIECDGRQFWGFDALEMLAAHLRGDPWFASGAWEDAGRARGGVQRKT